VRSITRRAAMLAATSAVLFAGVSYAATSQASTSCRGVTAANFPASGFITNPARTKGGNMWWQRLPDGSVCVGTVVEFVQYNVTMTKTWRVLVYTTQAAGGRVAASATFTVRPGWYFFGFQIRQSFQGLTAVCVTADAAFGAACLHF
jgi:hypothetical protein